MPTLVDVDGKLGVQADWHTMSDTPERIRYTWDTGARARGNDDLIGKTVSAYDSMGGCYWIDAEHYGRPMRVYILPDVKAIKFEREPIKPPRGGPWKYSWGEWVNQKTGARRTA